MNLMVLSAPWDDSLDIITLQQIHKFQGMNPMGLSASWSNSIEMIPLQPEKHCKVLTHWDVVPLGTNPI